MNHQRNTKLLVCSAASSPTSVKATTADLVSVYERMWQIEESRMSIQSMSTSNHPVHHDVSDDYGSNKQDDEWNGDNVVVTMENAHPSSPWKHKTSVSSCSSDSNSERGDRSTSCNHWEGSASMQSPRPSAFKLKLLHILYFGDVMSINGCPLLED